MLESREEWLVGRRKDLINLPITHAAGNADAHRAIRSAGFVAEPAAGSPALAAGLADMFTGFPILMCSQS